MSLDQKLGILLGVTFGQEKADAPANGARTVRAPLVESVQFIGAG
ncbi:hypothetical protein [Ferrimonas sediminum]|nr:hypothetical protein [Ferrimonas sediminum]